MSYQLNKETGKQEWITNEEAWDIAALPLISGKVSFAKAILKSGETWSTMAFENQIDRDFCECNALDFKTISVKDIKTKTVPIWEYSANAEKLSSLPQLDIAQFIEDNKKVKEAKISEKAIKEPKEKKPKSETAPKKKTEKKKVKVEKVKMKSTKTGPVSGFIFGA
jgi:cytochrome c